MNLPEYHDLDPYKTLDLSGDPSTISSDKIKKAYRKRALKCHPDKASSDEQRQEFHGEFQKVAFAYSILSDPKRKARFDKTGSLEDVVGDDEASIVDLFDDLCKGQVTKEMIEQDKKEYRESGEERVDILKYYIESKGDLDVVFENVLHSDITEDEDRFRSIIQDAISNKEVPSFKKFTKETNKIKSKRRKAAEREAAEAEQLAQEIGLDKKTDSSEESLALLIKSRGQKRFGSIIDNLEEKYGKGSSKSKKSKAKPSIPSEEEFEAIQKKLKGNQATKVKGS